MRTFHAVVRMDYSEAYVAMFGREHVQSQRIKSRSHKHTAVAAMIVNSAVTDHPSSAQLAAPACQYFKKFDTTAADSSLA